MGDLELIRPGRWPKPPDKLKTNILRELATGPKNWTDLWENEMLHNEAKSPKILQKALRELQDEGLIEQEIISHKNRPYSLTRTSMSFIDLRNIEINLKERIMLRNMETKHIRVKSELLLSIILHSLTIISDVDVSLRPYAEAWFSFYLMPIVFDYSYLLKSEGSREL